MPDKEPLPGMSEQEWLYREGRAITATGQDTGNPDLAMRGIEQSAEALRYSAASGLERIFTELFPGEALPEDQWEMRKRIDRQIMSPEEFDDLYKYDDKD